MYVRLLKSESVCSQKPSSWNVKVSLLEDCSLKLGPLEHCPLEDCCVLPSWWKQPRTITHPTHRRDLRKNLLILQPSSSSRVRSSPCHYHFTCPLWPVYVWARDFGWQAGKLCRRTRPSWKSENVSNFKILRENLWKNPLSAGCLGDFPDGMNLTPSPDASSCPSLLRAPHPT